MRGEASLAGRRLAIRLVGPWDASLRETRPEAARPMPAALKAIWQEPFGDRRTELVVIGQDMDKVAVDGGFGSFNPGFSIGIHAPDLLCAMTSMAVRASGSLPLPRNIAHRWASCTGKYLSKVHTQPASNERAT